jgi:hypothetical protein
MFPRATKLTAAELDQLLSLLPRVYTQDADRRVASKLLSSLKDWVDAVHKRLWLDPEHRARMIAARARSAEDRRANPAHYSRIGVPDGMRQAEAMKAWAVAREHANEIMRGLEAAGVVPKVVIPDSDEDKAKAALHEACVLALGPTDRRTKLAAARTVLAYTKCLPAQRLELKTASLEQWLADAAAKGCR